MGCGIPIHGLAVEGKKTTHGLEGGAMHVDVHVFQVALEVAFDSRESFGNCSTSGSRVGDVDVDRIIHVGMELNISILEVVNDDLIEKKNSTGDETNENKIGATKKQP